MQYTDHHIHSSCSPDAEDSMQDMAMACGERGVTTVCFTDHCDMDDYRSGAPDPDAEGLWRRSLDAYRETLGVIPSGLDLRIGVELGEMNHDPARAAALLASAPELDFVLASVHNLRNTPDFYALRYESEAHCRSLLHLYLAELTEVAAMEGYDNLSHIGYAKRYMLRAGYRVFVEDAEYEEELRQLLRTVIQNGKGIEVNTSGLRHPAIEETIPTPQILKIYKELGGERLTVGSDAHRTVDAGRGVVHTFDMLRELGFRYVCAYRRREPEFITL